MIDLMFGSLFLEFCTTNFTYIFITSIVFYTHLSSPCIRSTWFQENPKDKTWFTKAFILHLIALVAVDKSITPKNSSQPHSKIIELIFYLYTTKDPLNELSGPKLVKRFFGSITQGNSLWTQAPITYEKFASTNFLNLFPSKLSLELGPLWRLENQSLTQKCMNNVFLESPWFIPFMP